MSIQHYFILNFEAKASELVVQVLDFLISLKKQ